MPLVSTTLKTKGANEKGPSLPKIAASLAMTTEQIPTTASLLWTVVIFLWWRRIASKMLCQWMCSTVAFKCSGLRMYLRWKGSRCVEYLSLTGSSAIRWECPPAVYRYIQDKTTSSFINWLELFKALYIFARDISTHNSYSELYKKIRIHRCSSKSSFFLY